MNEDPNDPRKPIGGDGLGKDVGPWNTPGGDATIASSVQTGRQSNDDEDEHANQGNQVVSIDEQRELLQRQLMQWGIASGTSITAVTVAFVPAQIIVAFFITMSLFLGFAFTAFQRMRLEAMDLQRRGVAGYLPEGMVQELTQTSFHDFFVNGDFWEENGFYLLYFIPGLSEEQLNTYVNRLIPRHQDVLRRPGMGHFLGPAFMRLLLGEQRYAQEVEGQQQEAQDEARPVPRRLELTATGEVASHLGDDDHHIHHADDNATLETVEEHNEDATHATQTTGSDFSRFWGSPPPVGRVFSWNEEPSAGSNATAHEQSANIPLQARDLAATMNPPTEDEEEDELAIDAQVLRDAISGGISSISDGVYDAVSGAASDFFTGTPLRTGMTATAAAVGVGYLGVWMTGGPPSGGGRMPRSSVSSNSAIYSSILASGATAGIMYFFQVGRSTGGPGGNSGSRGGSSNQH